MTRCPGPGCAPVYRLLGLVRRYGPDPVEAACDRALDLDVVSVTKIASMLERPPSTPPPCSHRRRSRTPDSPGSQRIRTATPPSYRRPDQGHRRLATEWDRPATEGPPRYQSGPARPVRGPAAAHPHPRRRPQRRRLRTRHETPRPATRRRHPMSTTTQSRTARPTPGRSTRSGPT